VTVLKTRLFQQDHLVHLYTLYDNKIQLRYNCIYCYRMCVVFDRMVIFPFLFFNFPSKSVSLMLAYFIPSEWESVCLHFTITPNRPILNFRHNSSQQSRWYNFVSVNVTALTTVQLAGNEAEVLNPLYPESIRKLPTLCNRVSTGYSSHHSVVTMSECVAKYIHSLFINWTNIALFTSINSSQNFRNIQTVLKQLHSSGFLPITRHYSITFYRHKV